MDNLKIYSDKAINLILEYSPKIITALIILLSGLWLIKLIVKYEIFKQFIKLGT